MDNIKVNNCIGEYSILGDFSENPYYYVLLNKDNIECIKLGVYTEKDVLIFEYKSFEYEKMLELIRETSNNELNVLDISFKNYDINPYFVCDCPLKHKPGIIDHGLKVNLLIENDKEIHFNVDFISRSRFSSVFMPLEDNMKVDIVNSKGLHY